jgi:ParB/RepB/Spo0J family partition protein
MTQETIPVAKIVLGDNPRTYFDPEEHDQLVRSIRAIGLLTPVTVVADGDDYRLIAGERRLRAYQELELADIPAHVTVVKDDRAAAITENVVRSNLHPIEEGRAYLELLKSNGKNIKPATLSKQLGIPAGRIVNRIRLAQLPLSIADAMISGARIDRIRDILVEFCERFDAELVAQFVESELEQLNEATESGEVHDLFCRWIQTGYDKPVIDAGWQSYAHLEEGQELVQALRDKGAATFDVSHILNLNADDQDAATAYGCWVEFPDVGEFSEAASYITSREWLVDRLRQKVEAWVPYAAPKGTPPAREGYVDANGAAREPNADEQEAEKKAKRELAAAAKQVREEKGRANQAFGIALQRKLAKRKATAADAALIAEVILDREHSIGLAWKLVNPEAKLDGLDRYGKTRALIEWVTTPKSADGIFGRMFQVLLASMFHDEEAVVMSHRPGHGWYHLRHDQHLIDLLEQTAPPEIAAPIVERHTAWLKRNAEMDAEQAEHLAAAQARREEADLVRNQENTDGETTPVAAESTPENGDIDHVIDGLADGSIIEDPETGELTYVNVAPDDDPAEAEIQKLAQQSRDAMQAEIDRQADLIGQED